MKILIAMDSFKGNLSSLAVADIIESGIRRVYSSAIVDKVAIADGGEGTVETIADSLKGEYINKEVRGPIGNKVKARYAIVNGDTAVIEMAEASGLILVSERMRNPLIAST
jgi:glycerate 2-kinase